MNLPVEPSELVPQILEGPDDEIVAMLAPVAQYYLSADVHHPDTRRG